MTDCGCDKALAELENLLHNELGGGDALDVEEHLKHCPSCSDEHMVGLTLLQKLRSACSEEEAPEDLKAQVLALLQKAEREA